MIGRTTPTERAPGRTPRGVKNASFAGGRIGTDRFLGCVRTPMSDDPEPTLCDDERLDVLVEAFGVPAVEPAENGFRRLVVTIANQSVSTAAAETIRERVFDLYDRPVTPEATLALDPERLADAGLGERKAHGVRAAARAYRDGEIAPDELRDADAETVHDRITAVPGLGEWSARMYRIFVLGRPDVFPVGDLAVRRAMTDLYGYADDERPAMVDHAARWEPHRSAATLLLWRYYEADDPSTTDGPAAGATAAVEGEP